MISPVAWTVGGLVLVSLLFFVRWATCTLADDAEDYCDAMFGLLFAIVGVVASAWLIGAALTWAGVVA